MTRVRVHDPDRPISDAIDRLTNRKYATPPDQLDESELAEQIAELRKLVTR